MLKKKKSYTKVIYSPFTLFLIFLVFLVLLRALWGVYKKEVISAQYLQKEQEQLTAILSRQRELAQSVDYLKTDKGVESEIRSKFRVVREGESVAVIVDNDATTTSQIQATTTQQQGWWSKMWNAIGL